MIANPTYFKAIDYYNLWSIAQYLISKFMKSVFLFLAAEVA
jgi:hypothetical protein